MKESPGGVSEKLDGLTSSVNALHGTVGKLERAFLGVRRNMNSGYRHSQPQFGVVHSHSGSSERSICTADDVSLESGVRRIRKNFFAYCEMDEGENAGWIVIQNRIDGDLDFFRTWNEYKEGFGNIFGEFWMGLEKLHELTSSRLHELRIDLEDFEGKQKHAIYSAFVVSDEASSYAMSVLGKYSGTAGDSLKYHGGMKFSTHE